MISSSFTLQDQSSDMELESEEEPTEIKPSHKVSDLKTLEASVESPSNSSSKEVAIPPISRMRPETSPPHKASCDNLNASQASPESPLNPSPKGVSVPPISRMRPKGCDVYEDLSRSERGLVRLTFWHRCIIHAKIGAVLCRCLVP